MKVIKMDEGCVTMSRGSFQNLWLLDQGQQSSRIESKQGQIKQGRLSRDRSSGSKTSRQQDDLEDFDGEQRARNADGFPNQKEMLQQNSPFHHFTTPILSTVLCHLYQHLSYATLTVGFIYILGRRGTCVELSKGEEEAL